MMTGNSNIKKHNFANATECHFVAMITYIFTIHDGNRERGNVPVMLLKRRIWLYAKAVAIESWFA